MTLGCCPLTRLRRELPQGGSLSYETQKKRFPIRLSRHFKAPPLGELREAVRGQIMRASDKHTVLNSPTNPNLNLPPTKKLCPIGQSFFMDWTHSTKNSMDENSTNVPGKESTVMYTGPL